MDRDELARRRNEYETVGFDVADADPDPMVQFEAWYDGVEDVVDEPNAMMLATAAPDGWPGVRTVLLRGVDSRGLVFYTNYESAKAKVIEENPRVEALFLWVPVHRQVRVRGIAERVSAEESDAYFASRPRGAALGAWASPQSQIVPDRDQLDEWYAAADERFPEPVPRPPHWGGYRIRPDQWEFWQGRASRLHDRIRYRAGAADGVWIRERLAP